MKDVVCVRDVAGLALLPVKSLIRSEMTMQKAERSEPETARPPSKQYYLTEGN
jgi:hypothetical protein